MLITSTDTEGDSLMWRSVCCAQGLQRSSRKSMLKEDVAVLPRVGGMRSHHGPGVSLGTEGVAHPDLRQTK